MCQYDNMPIVEAWKVSGQQSTVSGRCWTVELCNFWRNAGKGKAVNCPGLLDFRQKNKDKRQCVNVPIVELVFACAFAFVCLNSNLRTRNRTRNSKPETRNSEPETQNPEPETRTPNPVTICEINCNYKLFFVLSHIVNTLQNKLIEHEYRFSKIRRPGTSNYTR